MSGWGIVKRGTDGGSATIEHVGVDHGGFDILVPKQFLYRANIVAVFEEVCGEAVSKNMGCNGFVYFCQPGCFFDCTLEVGFVEMVSLLHTAGRVY